MVANSSSSAAPPPVTLTGAEKVAVLLLALGKQRAAKLLRRFDAEELKLLTRSAAELRPVSPTDLETLVEEFAQKFSNGLNFVGTLNEVKDLLAGVMSEDEIDEAMSNGDGAQQQEVEDAIWERISRIKLDTLRAYLIKQHPQSVALILSKVDSELAAKLISSFPPELRNGLLSRMLGLRKVAPESVRAVELAIREELLAPSASSHASIADILNRLDRSQSEDVLKSLAEIRPDDAKALKGLLFTFEQLPQLPASARAVLFDQVPIERLVMALRGTEPEFQETILSSLAARSKRMAEAELQSGANVPQRDIAKARRSIVEAVLKMMAKGEIEQPSADDVDELTV
ncbi:MAG TPA: FliG C-terminal domain-containing protein [Hyphomicrobiaceae bacterium]|jgi:flagellar motor switch protein FliG|nr:FliG C-terminal domain-containing protein [Hyphomicrobiaceae bacterium]